MNINVMRQEARMQKQCWLDYRQNSESGWVFDLNFCGLVMYTLMYCISTVGAWHVLS